MCSVLYIQSNNFCSMSLCILVKQFVSIEWFIAYELLTKSIQLLVVFGSYKAFMVCLNPRIEVKTLWSKTDENL